MTKESIQPEINENDRLLRRVQFLHPAFIKPNGTPSSASLSLKKGKTFYLSISKGLPPISNLSLTNQGSGFLP